MKEIIPFAFEGKQIRVVRDENGEAMFVGKDIAEALGYADPTSAMKQHCRGVAKHHPIVDSLGRMQKVRVLTEGDMYRLMTHSKLEGAERFESLVFDDILPTIRKTGKYEAPKAKEQTGLDKLRIASALEKAEGVAERICARFNRLGENGQQVIFAKIINPLMGDEVIALPRVSERLLTASKVGEVLGVSANTVGRLANKHGMKTEEFGEFRLDKSPHSDKQVETFHYNAKAVSKLRELFGSEVAA